MDVHHGRGDRTGVAAMVNERLEFVLRQQADALDALASLLLDWYVITEEDAARIYRAERILRDDP